MQEAIGFTPQLTASPIANVLWLIPAVPMVAAGVIALLKQPRRRIASSLAIGSLGFHFPSSYNIIMAMPVIGFVIE